MTKEIKVNKKIRGHTIGQVVTVECDGEGTPLEFFWRRQLKAAEMDNCCEIMQAKTTRAPRVVAPTKSKDVK